MAINLRRAAQTSQKAGELVAHHKDCQRDIAITRIPLRRCGWRTGSIRPVRMEHSVAGGTNPRMASFINQSNEVGHSGCL